MPRNRPTKKLDVFGKYDQILDQAVTNYKESRQQEKYYM